MYNKGWEKDPGEQNLPMGIKNEVTEEMAFELDPEGRAEVCQAEGRRRNMPDRGKCIWKMK